MHVLGVDVAFSLPLGSREFIFHDEMKVLSANVPILKGETVFQVKYIST